ncbi:MAG: YveK family protein [Novosphingobium sp.]
MQQIDTNGGEKVRSRAFPRLAASAEPDNGLFRAAAAVPEAPEPEPSFARTVLGNWWILALSLVLCIGTAAYFASAEIPVYKARTTLVIGPKKDLKETREISDSLNTLDRRSVVATLAMLPTSRTVRQAAQQQLRLSDAQFGAYSIKTNVVPDSNALEVTAEGPDPRTAAALLAAVADQTVARTGAVYDIFEMQVLDRARAPSEPAGVGWPRKLLAGAIFGLLIGIAAAFMLAYVRSGRLSGLLAEIPGSDIGEPDAEPPRFNQGGLSELSMNLRTRAYGRARRSTDAVGPSPSE